MKRKGTGDTNKLSTIVRQMLGAIGAERKSHKLDLKLDLSCTWIFISYDKYMFVYATEYITNLM